MERGKNTGRAGAVFLSPETEFCLRESGGRKTKSLDIRIYFLSLLSQYISVAVVVELRDRERGGGWDS